MEGTSTDTVAKKNSGDASIGFCSLFLLCQGSKWFSCKTSIEKITLDLRFSTITTLYCVHECQYSNIYIHEILRNWVSL